MKMHFETAQPDAGPHLDAILHSLISPAIPLSAWYPSTSIADAWVVIEYLQHRDFNITLYPDTYHGYAMCAMRVPQAWFHLARTQDLHIKWKELDIEGTMWPAEGKLPSTPLAICRAFVNMVDEVKTCGYDYTTVVPADDRSRVTPL